MANFENTLNVHDGAAVTNWISQINAGGTVYDIATHHSIKFVEGNEETTWNGLSDLTVVIPTIQDIVQTPIEFAGTVGADGNVSWNATHTDGPKVGYLVFVTADCTFNDIACEAGDMAIYDGTKWNVVSGENQVKIVAAADAASGDGANTHTVAVGAAKNVLTVEGKTLALTLDYADLNANHLTVGKTFGKDVSVEFGDVTVAGVGLKLNQGDATPTTIGTTTTFVEATALADGTVTLTNADSLVREVNFGTFTPGTLPEGKKNTQKTLAVTGGSVVKGAGSDFVTNVTLGNVTFEEAGEGDTNKITAITSVTGKQEGQEFYKGIHLTKEDETADIAIAGAYIPTRGVNATFVDGLEDGKTSVITGFTEGSFSFTTGAKEVVTGFEGSDEVIDTVTASVKSTENVLNSAYVENNVLHFGNVDVASEVEVSTTTRNLQLSKTGYSYESAKATSSKLSSSGFTQAEGVGYTFDKANETIYTTETGMWKLNTPQLGVDKGAYTLSNVGMIATVDAGTFVESVSGGVLPEWKGYSAPTVKVEGTVGTALTTNEISIIGLNDAKINMPGVYTLASVEAGKGDVTVAAAGSDVVTIGESSVNLKGYLTDVTVTIA